MRDLFVQFILNTSFLFLYSLLPNFNFFSLFIRLDFASDCFTKLWFFVWIVVLLLCCFRKGKFKTSFSSHYFGAHALCTNISIALPIFLGCFLFLFHLLPSQLLYVSIRRPVFVCTEHWFIRMDKSIWHNTLHLLFFVIPLFFFQFFFIPEIFISIERCEEKIRRNKRHKR